jgi:hypothetical protein
MVDVSFHSMVSCEYNSEVLPAYDYVYVYVFKIMKSSKLIIVSFYRKSTTIDS